VSLTSAASLSAAAQPSDRPHIQTGESYIEDVLSPAHLPLDDPRATFAAIFASLGDRAKIYPTENYYYFSFFQNGVRYGGNFRLAASDRDEGKLHFAYFDDFAEWRTPPLVKHITLDASDGVAVERMAPFQYRVTFQSKAVLFDLNDLTGARPRVTAPSERYIGPIFDESAVRFFLVFNTKAKLFHYILDETAQASDELIPLSEAGRILIGKRTGFAYYRDHRLDRKILIGVFDANVHANNYLDGPFDQLPDNFIEGDALRRSIIAAEPGLAGKIDRFGYFLNGAGRYLIAPYLRYHHDTDLLPVDRCATRKRATADEYAACFRGTTEEPQMRSELRPRRLR
jgi:hypothetical protein